MRDWIGMAFVMGMVVAGSAMAGERLFTGGVVHTPNGVVRAAVLVRDGRIVTVAPRQQIHLTANAKVIDLHGSHVLPGLCDAHLHLTGYGRSLEEVDLRGAQSWPEVIRRARVAASHLPSHAWLTGRGWDQNLWPGKKFPDRRELDRAFPDRPVLLRRIDGHAAVANAVALRAAGIGRETKDPPGGRILHREDGAPTGVLVDGAVDLALRAVPKPDDATVERWILRSARALLKDGFVQVHDAGTTAQELRVLRRLDAAGRLPIRVYVLLDGSDDGLLARELRNAPSWAGPAMLRVGGVKLYADGALGSRGALLGADYADDPGNRGLAVTPIGRLREVIRRASTAGYQVGVHAIGDEAVHRVLDLYAEVGAARCRRLRHRIEHSQIVRPGDVRRYAKLGIVASVQPTHCTSDMPWAPSRLGPGRIGWAYRWRSFLDAGVRLAGGSDAPVEDPDPRRGLYAAVTRQLPDGTPPGGWNPAERLTPAEALALFTTGAAWAGHCETWSGEVAPGFAADLTVVGADPLTVKPHDLLRLPILRTVVGGIDRWVAPVGGAS
ncbi:MAG TPA: amidohydrolase [Acidobacteria bacterium]|nr:amidohydrolase [Acidobacteriota bacterium]